MPAAGLDADAALWVMYAWVLTKAGQQIESVEEKLQAAEVQLQYAEPDETIRDLIGQIATIRALLAGPQAEIKTMLAQSQRALDYLRADNLPVRTLATWARGLAHQYRGQRAAARQVYTDAVAISRASGNTMVTIAALTCLGQVQEADNQLHRAQESYQHVLALVGDPPWATACEAVLGLARLFYQWNDLDRAEHYARQAFDLGQQIENSDTPAAGLLLARLFRAQGDPDGAASALADTEQLARQRKSAPPDAAHEQVLALLDQGRVAAAAHLAETINLPISRARVLLAQREYAAALSILAEVGWIMPRPTTGGTNSYRRWCCKRSFWRRAAIMPPRGSTWTRRSRWPRRTIRAYLRGRGAADAAVAHRRSRARRATGQHASPDRCLPRRIRARQTPLPRSP